MPGRHPSIAIVGPGRLGSALATGLRAEGYVVTELVTRNKASATTRSLGRKTASRVLEMRRAKFESRVIWLCVPDSQITKVAGQLASRDWAGKIAFHSSGVLSSAALHTLKNKGASIASVHPLMTFIDGALPELRGVSFAIEGGLAAVRTAFGIVRALNANPVHIRKQDKPAYHAFATIVCPLLVALLASAEETARLAGVPSRTARKRMLPIVQQTIANYMRVGAAKSFTGPVVRGDSETVQVHLEALRKLPTVQRAYAALVEAAIDLLPTRNKQELKKTLSFDRRRE